MTSTSSVVPYSSFVNSSVLLKKLLSLTFTGLLLLFSSQLMAQVIINEIRIDHPGSDIDEYIELSGAASSSLTGLTYIVIGDGTGGSGVIESITDLSSQTIDANGLFVVAESTFTLGTANMVASLNFENSDNVTHMLVTDFTGSTGDDLDTNDDGVFDITPWGAIADCVALVETVGSGDMIYCATTVGPDGGFVPSHVRKCPGDWVIGDYDIAIGSDTPGEENICVVGDSAPAVTSTSPADTATGVAVDANIVINFSEPVGVTGSWFEINCASSGVVSAVASGGPQTYSLNPESDLALSESCDVKVTAALVSDTDAEDPPDAMEADFTFSFTTTDGVLAPLVINEIDYDQAGSDTGEFFEIRNNSTDAVNLAGYSAVFVNGSNGSVYRTVALPDVSLASGDYFVVCGNSSIVPNCDLDVSPDTNLIQNGAPDGLALMKDGTIIDAVSYEGDLSGDYTEGTGVKPGDTNSIDYIGISRAPDGSDTDDNDADFELRCITPGKANSLESTGCEDPRPPALKVNEIDYDQPGSDAAEFVEIFNAGNSSANLANVELVLVNGKGNGAVIYKTINLPDVELAGGGYFVVCANAATVPNCDFDVSPDTNLIQNGAPDAVAVLVDGVLVDTVSYEGDTGAPYTEGSGIDLTDSGSTGQDNLGISRYPSGVDTDQNNVDLTNVCITPGFANSSLTVNCEAGGPALEIHDIQGSGATSPFANQGVATLDNIVTAVGPEGFFIQTPDNRLDGDDQSSNGIYVFTGSAPSVLVGDQVDVSGEVVEFYEFTEFAMGSIVTVDSSGNALPASMILDSMTPSNDPASPSCASGTLECFEGMRVEISNGAVTGGNQGFGSDPVAEVFVTAADSRTFREPGVSYPGLGGLIPTWDGNPEVFEMDPDKLGLPSLMIAGGSSFTASGVIGFEYGDYELWPTSLDVTPAVLPREVRSKNSGETTVGSFNLFRFATDGEYSTRLTKLSLYIRNVLKSPDILAVQEVDGIGALQDLADTIALDDSSVNYTAHLVEGNDIGGIDVGYLVRSEVKVDSTTQFGKDEMFSYDGSLLHDRPPLLLEGRYTGNGRDFPLAVLVVHNRSLNGIDTERVQLKRLTQAESIAQMVQTYQSNNPNTPLIVVGDFNAYEFTDGYADIVGHIKGDFNPAESVKSGLDLVNPNLTNQVDLLPASERYSFVFQGNAQALDHALTSQSAAPWVRGLQYGRGNADAAKSLLDDPSTAVRSSDHDGLVVFLMTDFDGDGVGDDADSCPANDRLVVQDPENGCVTPIPTLGPLGLLLMLIVLGGVGMLALRPQYVLK